VAIELGLVRRFPFLWGMLTATYGFAVAYRALAQSILPGLPTFAAFTAITAVWLGFFQFVHTRRVLRIGIVVTIAATILLNTASIVSSALNGKGLLIEQSVFTIMFVYVLLAKVQALHRRPKSQEQGNED
jgi:hypothetical protein